MVMAKKRYKLPAFLEVLVDGQMIFVPVSECRDNAELRGQVVNKALAELEAWCAQYGDLFDFLRDQRCQRVIRALRGLKREMGSEWPMLPDSFYSEDATDADT
jgi:hypothetical protein